MADTAEPLIADLTGTLRPVRRLAPPAQRALLWLGVAALIFAAVAATADLGALRQRLMQAPDLLLAATGTALTAIAAAFAAFQTSVPGRSAAWAWLPAPPFALWLAASGAGCLRPWLVPGAEPEPAMHPLTCLTMITLYALPLSALALLLLRRAFPLRPGLTAFLAGLASAAAAATILLLIHPYDATALDLVAHGTAVGIVVGLNRLLGGKLLAA